MIVPTPAFPLGHCMADAMPPAEVNFRCNKLCSGVIRTERTANPLNQVAAGPRFDALHYSFSSEDEGDLIPATA
jgi:hypothetical protein